MATSFLVDFAAPTRVLAALLLALVLMACNSPMLSDPVATVSLEVNRLTVPLGGPLEMSIRFVTVQTLEPLDEDYRVMVHFLDVNGEMMWAADHYPVTPTSQWQAGQTVAYTRRVHVPMYPYIGDATVAVGLYSTTTGVRLSLFGDDLGQRTYRGTVVSLKPQQESSWLMYEDGWYDDEFDPGSNKHWRWTKDSATMAFRNPYSEAVLFLEVDGRPDFFDTPQRVALRLGEETVKELVIESRSPQFYRIPLQTDQLGDADTVRLEIKVDQTFVPAEVPGGFPSDRRSLGVRVFYAFLEPS